MIRAATALLCTLVLVGVTGAIEVSGPAEITAPGEYRLTADLTAGGIVVSAGDVVLDGDGHHVIGSLGAGSYGILISGPVSNVTVRSLDVAGWEVGVEVRDAVGVRLERIRAENCSMNGVYVKRCRKVEVKDCVASGNALPGIALNASDGCWVSGTASNGNADVGFYVTGSRDVSIEGCRASANGLNGIFLEETESVRVRGCTLDTNGYPGIAAADTGRLLIADNLATGNLLAAAWIDRPGPSVVVRNVAVGSEVGLVVRNTSVRPFVGGNLWQTERGVDGETRLLPTIWAWSHLPVASPTSS